MDWMNERVAERANPKILWEDVRSIVMLGMSYAPESDPLAALNLKDRGVISVYARSRDYHDVIKGKLKQIAGVLAAENEAVKVFVDTAPVMEKPLAAAAGLGWQGKHTVLVSREHGSWLFLGAIFTTAELPPDEPEADHCGSCARCLSACPTEALLGDGTLDARACVSYLTIEHTGPIPPSLWPGIGDWLFGCDLCGEACPWERFGKVWKALRPEPELAHPDLLDFFRLSGRAFGRKYAGTAFLRAGRARMARNALIVLFNLGLGEALFLEATRDPNPLVRRTALRALHLMGKPLDPFLQDPGLREEALALLGEAPEAVHLLQDGREAPGPEVKEQGA